jgi:hypothetical protein
MKTSTNFAVQMGGAEYSVKETEGKVKEKVKEKGILMKKVRDIDIYMKPEESRAYYVAHSEEGDIMDSDFVALNEEN